MVERRQAEPSRRTRSWPALTVGSFLAGILAMGVGRAFGLFFPQDSNAALVAHVAVAVALAGGAGLTIGTSDLLRARWRELRNR